MNKLTIILSSYKHGQTVKLTALDLTIQKNKIKKKNVDFTKSFKHKYLHMYTHIHTICNFICLIVVLLRFSFAKLDSGG